MRHTTPQKQSNKFWVYLFSSLAVLCLGCIFAMRFFVTNTVAVITKDGEEVARIDLQTVTESYTIPLDGNVILVEHGKISMQSADCPDKLCIRQGVLQTNGRIVCLPNRVIITMEHSKDGPDAKVG